MDNILKELSNTLINISNLAYKNDSINSCDIVIEIDKLKNNIVENNKNLTNDENKHLIENLNKICNFLNITKIKN